MMYALGAMMGRKDKQPDKPSCPKCQVPMSQYGFGSDYAAFSCECGAQSITRGGKTEVTTRRQRQKRFYELRNHAFDLLEKQEPETYRKLSDLIGEF